MLHKVLRKQDSSDDCLVCGVKNDLGVKANFYEVEGDELVALATLKNEHQSYPGRCHGGIIAALLDETIGRAINITEPEAFGVTTNLDIKYRKPVPLKEEIKIIGRITKSNSRMFEGTGEIISKDGRILAEATGIYAKLPMTSIATHMTEEECAQMMYPVRLENEPTEIDY